ncbi:hypothetical protein AUJ84_01855 [Candidatus Pacearchaeota archaeon CG1_02_32_132]|nr:MAG: hypothetical protein AUJ84_01855 [Candidatus Pacearchaeota archaeon CG1_02_32_132]
MNRRSQYKEDLYLDKYLDLVSTNRRIREYSGENPKEYKLLLRKRKKLVDLLNTESEIMQQRQIMISIRKELKEKA